MPNSSCHASPVKLAALRPGVQAGVCVAVLLGIERAREVTLRSGDKATRASLYLADESKPLGVELTVWGANALRIAYLRPLVILHVPGVSLRVSQYGVESLTCAAPQNIITIDETSCECRKSTVAAEVAAWNQYRHSALNGVVLRAAPPPTTEVPSRSVPAEPPKAEYPVEWVRGRVSGMRIRSVHKDIATALRNAVIRRCKGCGVSTTQNCSCAHGVGVEHVLDEDAVAVRVEFGDDIVAHSAGADLALLLLFEPAELEDMNNAERAARVLGALAADKGEFDIGIQQVRGEPVPRLRSLRF